MVRESRGISFVRMSGNRVNYQDQETQMDKRNIEMAGDRIISRGI